MELPQAAVFYYAALSNYSYDGHWVVDYHCDIRNMDGTT